MAVEALCLVGRALWEFKGGNAAHVVGGGGGGGTRGCQYEHQPASVAIACDGQLLSCCAMLAGGLGKLLTWPAGQLVQAPVLETYCPGAHTWARAGTSSPTSSPSTRNV